MYRNHSPLLNAAGSIATLLLLAGCSMGSHFAVDREAEFRYVPPDLVSEEDRKVCRSRALSAASERSYEVTSSEGTNTWATHFGLIGSLSTFTYVYEAEEAAYTEEYKDCLREKGYAIK